MHAQGIIDYALWGISQTCLLLLTWQIMRQRVAKEFPFFIAYCIFQVIRSTALLGITLWGIRQHYLAYFLTYWISELLAVCLSLAVIRDIYQQFFRHYPALQAFGDALFHWASALLVLISAWSAASANGKEFDRVIAGVLVFDEVSTTVRGGLLLLLLVIALFFKLRWNQRFLGIVIGYSLYLVVDFVAIAMRRHAGTIASPSWSILRSIAFGCCTLTWVWAFFRPHVLADQPFPFTASQLDEWNAALKDVVR
jgi:hypothetical protein